jgi:ABC-type uncharacterized transport system involved in gliding motility auxiliary subunit
MRRSVRRGNVLSHIFTPHLSILTFMSCASVSYPFPISFSCLSCRNSSPFSLSLSRFRIKTVQVVCRLTPSVSEHYDHNVYSKPAPSTNRRIYIDITNSGDGNRSNFRNVMYIKYTYPSDSGQQTVFRVG